MISGKRSWLLFVGLSLILLGAAQILRQTLLHQPADAMAPPGSLHSATITNDSKPLPAFTLHSADGVIDNAALQDRWSLLFFGYTFCPDICPTTLASVREMLAHLDAAVVRPQVLFVSVDPARDSPDRLSAFVRFFDPAFLGAVGDDAAIADLVKHLGVHYQRLDEKDKNNYVVDHTAAVYLIDPQGRLKAVFSWPHEPAVMAADYQRIIIDDY